MDGVAEAITINRFAADTLLTDASVAVGGPVG